MIKNSNAFSLSFSRLATLLLPVLLRKSGITCFLNACLTPLKQCYNSFLSARQTNITKTLCISQTAVLERYLNSFFRIKSSVFKLYDPEVAVFRQAWSEESQNYGDTFTAYSENGSDLPLNIFSELSIDGDSVGQVVVRVPSNVYTNTEKMRQVKFIVQNATLPGIQVQYVQGT